MTEDGVPDELLLGPTLDSWGQRVGLRAHLLGPDVIRSWTDLVTDWILRRDGDEFVVDNREKGSVQSWARFGSIAEAETYLLATFVSAWSSGRGLPGSFPRDVADGATVVTGVGGSVLTEPSGRRSMFRFASDAGRYSQVAGLTPTQIEAVPWGG